MTDESILAQLRHMYSKLASESVVKQKILADGFLAPVIKELERRQRT